MSVALQPLALVVEDDYFQRSALADLLRGQNFSVIDCDCVEAADLVLAKTGLELTLLVTDVDLGPGRDGLELAAFALKTFPSMRVVIVSGQNHFSIPDGAVFLQKLVLRRDMAALSLT